MVIILSGVAGARTLSQTIGSTPALEASQAPTVTVDSPAAKDPTSTSVPATKNTKPDTTPVRSRPPELILAISKPERKTSVPGNVVFKLPTMNEVLLASELTYYDSLKVDIYYPPNYKFEAKLPVVILSHGFKETEEFDKDMPQHMDWARLIAASGMIAVSAQAGDAPVENSQRVFSFLSRNAAVLGLDLKRIGFWAVSGQCKPTFRALEDEKSHYRNAFKAAVFLYPSAKSAKPSGWPQTISLFVVKAGNDQLIPGEIVDSLVAQARSSKISTEYIEMTDAPHGFDVYQDSQASKDNVRQALEFLKGRLLP